MLSKYSRNIFILLICALLSVSCASRININYDISNINERLKDYLDKHVSDNQFPGIQYVIFDDSKILFSYSGGMAKIKLKEKVHDNTLFNVFSTTKIITAAAILQLAEKNLLSLDDTIDKHLNNIPYKNITIRQILSHSSGIPDPFLGNFYIHWSDEHKGYDRDDILNTAISENNQLSFTPGQEILYSNLGYAILGKLIEKVTGTKYEQYVEKHIFSKLLLNNSEINFGDQSQPNSARPYFKRYSLVYNILAMLLEGNRTVAEGKWKAIDKTFYFNFPAHGGIVASAREYSKIYIDLLKENSLLLENNTKQAFFKKQIEHEGKVLALGWFKKQVNNIPYLFHQGGGLGYISEVRLYPEEKIGSVLLINKTDLSSIKILDTLDLEYLKGNDTTL